MASPMPLLAPVTRTSLSRRSRMFSGSRSRRLVVDGRGPRALGDRVERVAAAERARRTGDLAATLVAGEAGRSGEHAVGGIELGALHTGGHAHVRVPAAAR